MRGGRYEPFVRVRWRKKAGLIHRPGVAHDYGISDSQVVTLRLAGVTLRAIEDWWVKYLGDVIQSGPVLDNFRDKRL